VTIWTIKLLAVVADYWQINSGNSFAILQWLSWVCPWNIKDSICYSSIAWRQWCFYKELKIKIEYIPVICAFFWKLFYHTRWTTKFSMEQGLGNSSAIYGYSPGHFTFVVISECLKQGTVSLCFFESKQCFFLSGTL